MFPICKSAYSIGIGVSSPAQLCKQAQQLGYKKICIADRNNLYGLPECISASKKTNLTPVIGAEITDLTQLHAIICLVKTAQGYRNLCRIISCRHCHFDFDFQTCLANRHEGIIGLTNNPNLVRVLEKIGMEIYLDKGLVAGTPRPHSQVAVTRFHHCIYAKQEDKQTHHLLRTIHLKKTIHAVPKKSLHSFMRPQPAASHSGLPHGGVPSIAIAMKIHFTGPEQTLIMPPYTHANHRSPKKELQHRAIKGATIRYGEPISDEVMTRLHYELQIIEAMHFSAYFLVVQDIVRTKGRDNQYRRICGRGSGAASLVAYCLHITNVCPIKHNLYFERFLHPGRIDPPDIDIDFAWDERDEVLQEIFTRYKRHAAMVCNHVFYQPRTAIREVAKAYGLPNHEISMVTKRMHLQQPNLVAPWPAILKDAHKIIGLPRHLSVHPGGVVITPSPISHYVPIQYSSKKVPIIQWEKDGAEFFGLVKIDILGNRSLGVIRDTTHTLRRNGIELGGEQWIPEDDPATRQTIKRGETMGCFYIESPAMRLLQKKAASGDFEQLVIQSSIIRPAANEFTREYVRRLRGGQWHHLHPSLSHILDESFGLMIYQEDVSRVAVALAGFSHKRADGLRKVMSKKDKYQKLQDYEQEFKTGAKKRGIKANTTDEIWQMIMSFSGYSFCKPHSASYAKVSYQAAYLKTHYPAEFMAAVLGNEGGYYSTFAYVSEAKRLRVIIDSPCVQRSQATWNGGNGRIRPGLLSIKGISRKSCTRLLGERQKRPFFSLTDLLFRVHPNQDEAIALVHTGACDSFSKDNNRTVLLWHIAEHFYHKKRSGQTMFNPSLPPPPRLKRPKSKRQSRREYKFLGFLTHCHPLTLCVPFQTKRTMAKNIPRHSNQTITIAGWLIAGKLVRTKQGDPMEFLSFEDETGLFETTFFPGAYRRYSSLLEIGYPFLLRGKVDEDFETCTIVVQQVQRL